MHTLEDGRDLVVLGGVLDSLRARRAGQPLQLALGLAPQLRLVGWAVGEELRSVMQRGGDRARGRREGLLLRREKEALHLAHVAVTRPGQHQQHERHERELGAQRESHPPQSFQR